MVSLQLARPVDASKVGWINEEEIRQGLEDARMAIEFGDDDPVALIWAGHAIGILSGEHERAIDVIERGLFLNPNSADGWWRLGWMQVHFEADKAIEQFERAMRLSPRDPHISFSQSGVAWAHFLAGRYDQSRRWANRSLNNEPRFLPALRVKIAACGYIGQLEEAKLTISNALQIDPTASLSKWVKFGAKMAQHNLELFVEGWRKAGLPE
jgi:tetratricopeptide (TPR) repeat protein